ncbi:MAG: 2-C-methyl-D-erythritol 4-phosphate cytidylyltransferase [Hydrogenophilales bacterium]|nr:2-C-methyl-D-erythritol 4-phosphate cytidylyltransferase [Hydrogenophilales bacterium]
MNAPGRCFALIPAAGSGSRMGVELPKQYLEIAGEPMLRHAVRALCTHPKIEQVFVVLADDDAHFASYDWTPFDAKLRRLYCGGATRAESVLNGLRAIDPVSQPEDWVLVHDAARPCLAQAHLDTLIAALAADEVGGLLAVPVADTLKRADADARVIATEPRENLWQAQTPQMFRHGLLLRALETFGAGTPTDEARAIEHMGLKPKLVACDATNLKVTYPQDLKLAELILSSLKTV